MGIRARSRKWVSGSYTRDSLGQGEGRGSEAEVVPLGAQGDSEDRILLGKFRAMELSLRSL